MPDAETMELISTRPDALVVLTKCDLGTAPPVVQPHTVLPTSALRGTGIEALRSALAREAERLAGVGDAPAISRARHRHALTEAVECLTEAAGTALPELAAEGYRAALQALGRLTGRVQVEAVLDDIFGEFCIGK
jgi:tRNA modification GTPase